MHGLDVIISRNAKAAGREAAHAVNDGDHGLAKKIADSLTSSPPTDVDVAVLQGYSDTFLAGYLRGREEK